MLKVLKQLNVYKFSPLPDDTGDTLFKKNPILQFLVEAPIYWWVDVWFPKFNLDMPLSDFNCCFDAWPEQTLFMQALAMEVNNPNIEPRQLMQILPMSTQVVGIVELTYQEIVEICENYVSGEYVYHLPRSFPNEREWVDFCETLLDIKGVRDFINEEE